MNFGPDQTTEPSGYKPLVVNVVVVGPLEEEEEGTVVVSDVVQVQGEDLDTPGYLRGDRVRLERRRSRIVGASPFAHDEVPGPYKQFSNIGLIKQSNTSLISWEYFWERFRESLCSGNSHSLPLPIVTPLGG